MSNRTPARLAALSPLLGLLAACVPAAPPPDLPPDAPRTIPVGAGDLEASAADGRTVALCLRAEHPRLVVVDLADGSARDLTWPLDPAARCERLALGAGLVCAAGYDAGIGCVPRRAGAPPFRPAIDAPPTGLAWDGERFWAATDGGGLWRFAPDGAAERVLDLDDLMSGLVTGPFGVTWGTGGEYAWRTRLLPPEAGEPRWIRPRRPPNVRCEDELEVCEWVSAALGVFSGCVYFAAVNAPAPLYRWTPADGSWEELQAIGEVLVGPAGVWAVGDDGGITALDPRGFRFVDTGVRLSPGEVAVPAAGGLWAAGRGVLRLVVPGVVSDAPVTSPSASSGARGSAR